MKRHLLIIAIFLLLGAVVNVAVAWGCTVWSGFYNPCEPPPRRAVPSDWPPVERGSWPPFEKGISGLTTQSGFGWTSEIAGQTENQRRDRPFLRDAKIKSLTAYGAGWPIRSLRAELWFTWEGKDVLKTLPSRSVSGGWLVSRKVLKRFQWATGRRWPLKFGLAQQSHLLPFAPIWSGFIINTLFYAAILWLLIPGPFVLRRFLRVKRGLCPKCEHPIGESSVCTECGRELPKPAPG